MACGLGAKVYLIDSNLQRLRYLNDVMPPNCFTLVSSPATIRRLIREADLVVGSVLIPGAKAPKLVTRGMLKTMTKGAVLVDVAIDQGGCFETSKPTTHKDPVYTVDGVIHYCVTNMPGALAQTSTLALTNATLPYAVEIADKGWKKAMQENPEIREGANVVRGRRHLQGGRRRLRPEIHAHRHAPLIVSFPRCGDRSVPTIRHDAHQYFSVSSPSPFDDRQAVAG